MALTALIATHHQDFKLMWSFMLQGKGYAPVIVDGMDQLIRRVSSEPTALVLMDMNYGHNGSPDISPALQIYDQTPTPYYDEHDPGTALTYRQRVERGDAHFIGVSNQSFAHDAARDAGIPHCDSYSLMGSIDSFLAHR